MRRRCERAIVSTVAVLAIVGMVAWWWLFVLGLIGYGIALAAHPLVQRNRPFARQPLWGFVSDLRMLGLALTGKLQPHLIRAESHGDSR